MAGVIAAEHMHKAPGGSTVHVGAVHMRATYGPPMAKSAEKALLAPPRLSRGPAGMAEESRVLERAPERAGPIDEAAQQGAWAYVERLVQATGLDRTKLARKAGFNPSTITDSRLKGGHPITARTIEMLARTFKAAPPPGLIERLPSGRNRAHQGSKLGEPMDSPSLPPIPGVRTNDVPIFGALMVGRGPLFHLNRMAVDMAPRPWGIRTARKAYALRMPDETMTPWRRAGELVFIDPARPVRRGDHALFLLGDPHRPNEDSVCLIREVIGAADAPTARQMAAYSRRGPEDFLADFVVTERHRVLEWEEALFG